MIAAAALLLASGAAALIYQVLWVKQLSLIVGVDVYAVTIGVSAFFAGLGLGGYLFGKLADRSRRPLLLYAALELGVALLGIGATFGLARAAWPFAMLLERGGLVAWVIPLGAVGIPAVLMGGSLPVLVRSLTADSALIGSVGGRLYSANTAGALLGTLLTTFLLLPILGVQGTGLLAASINLAAAAGALAIDRLKHSQARETATTPNTRLSKETRRALFLYAIAGGIALGYEVIWSQTIVQFLSTRAFAFSIVLATYLAGLVAGSAWYARRADRTRDPWATFALLIAAAGFLSVLEIGVLGNWLMNWQSDLEEILRAATGSELAAMCGRFAAASLGIVFLPTALLGAAFPVALRLASSGGSAGRRTGLVISLNTFGGIAGTLLTGFVLIPAVGLIITLGILAMAATSLALYVAARERSIGRVALLAIFAAAAATVIVVAFTPKDQLARLLPRTRRGGTVAFYEESSGGTVAVIERQVRERSDRMLYIQGVSNSGDTMTSLRYMRLQALLPLLIHRGEPHSALVVGLGTGITVGALLEYPGLEQRVCAELLPAVSHAAFLFHGNFGASKDPRIDLRFHDGRRELMQNSRRYDVITLEPPPPSAAGVVNLYSGDFYRLARSRLQPNGIFAQWLPLPTQNVEDSRSLVRSFLDAFPYASLWTTEVHETLLMGSPQPMELNVPRIVERFNYPPVSNALNEVGIASPAALLATWVTDRRGLERFSAGALPVTDDRPRIEYASWVRRGEFARVLPQVLDVRSDAPLIGADDNFRQEVSRERDTLMAFYAAVLYAYRGEREPWARMINTVISRDPTNAYYRWIIGGASGPTEQR